MLTENINKWARFMVWGMLGMATSTTTHATIRAEEGAIVGMIDAATLQVRFADRVETMRVAGVRAAKRCKDESVPLAIGEPVSVGWTDLTTREGTVSVIRRGKPADYGVIGLRGGLLYARARPGWRYEHAYQEAESEAEAMGSGTWACVPPERRYREIEKVSGLPAGLLYGVALTESKLNDRPWPWSLNVKGRTYRYASRMDLWQAIESLLRRGETRFDVGPLQVNWHWNGKRFRNTWEATHPWVNAAAAAQILLENYAEVGAWNQAVAHYHSRQPHRGLSYYGRFYTHYSNIIRKSAGVKSR